MKQTRYRPLPSGLGKMISADGKTVEDVCEENLHIITSDPELMALKKAKLEKNKEMMALLIPPLREKYGATQLEKLFKRM